MREAINVDEKKEAAGEDGRGKGAVNEEGNEWDI